MTAFLAGCASPPSDDSDQDPGADAPATPWDAGDETVGFQVGWRIDAGAVTWLDPVVAGHKAFAVPVEAGQTENATTGQRWDFVYRYSVAGMGHDCYTGPIFASHPMLIAAVRAPMG